VPRKDTARATISLRAPQPGEAVERAALELAAKMALGGPKPEELAEILRLPGGPVASIYMP
jgi:hypothetical protein